MDKKEEYIDLMEAEFFGALFFTEAEIAIILTESPQDFRTSVLKGRLQKDAEIRKIVIAQAELGSDQAQKLIETWKMRIALEEAR